MKIVTISREFGSGGRELGKRLADELGFDYYDREIITAISQNKGYDEKYVENALNNHGWKSIPLTYKRSFTSYISGNSAQINIFLEQKRVIESIAKQRHDCVIVGQNADIYLAQYDPFTLFVCADMGSKVKRCVERASDDEKYTKKQIEQNIRRIDKNRASNRDLVGGSAWGDRSSYKLIVNTTDWDMKKLVLAVKDYIMHYWEIKQ